MARRLLTCFGMSSIAKWPKRDRPRERLLELGPGALSDSEVLALLLGTGTERENAVEVARRILLRGGGVETIARLGIGELGRIDGLGEVKASRIVAAVSKNCSRSISRDNCFCWGIS